MIPAEHQADTKHLKRQKSGFMKEHRHAGNFIVFICLLFLLLFVFSLSLSLGSVSVPVKEVFSYLFGGNGDPQHMKIIREIRLPRATLALFSGGALAISGYLLQTFFRNPIAGPFVLGISSGARFSACVLMVIVAGQGFTVSSAEMVGWSFAGAMLATGIIILLSFQIKSMGILLVAGFMVSYIMSACTDFLISFADDASIINLHGWTQGSFSGTAPADAAQAALLIAVVSVVVFFLSKPIGAYQSGERFAETVGVHVRLLQLSIIVSSSLLSGVVTAFAGPVSFVGVAVPFIVRTIMKDRRPLVMLPALFLTGAVFTLVSDLLARMLLSPMELSLSTVTSVIGAPLVLIMMAGRKREREL